MCRGVLTLSQGRASVEFSCDSRGPKRSTRRTVQDGEHSSVVYCTHMAGLNMIYQMEVDGKMEVG